MNENIKKLQELTGKLPNFLKGYDGIEINYQLTEGSCIGKGILNTEQIAVQVAILTKGSVFPTHIHKSKEWLILYEGRLKVTRGDKVSILEVGHSIYFVPSEPHSVEALEYCLILGITIPSEKGYPNASRT